MPEIITIVNRFDGGISDDRRVKISNKFALTKHFDTFSYKHKLVPHFKTEEKTWAPAKICKFVYAPATAQGAGKYRLFGLGVKSETLIPAIVQYDIDSGFTNNWEAASSTAAKWESSGTNRTEDAFFYYKNFLYAWQGRYLGRYDTMGAADYNANYYDAGAAPGIITQPVHHPSDDIAYFFEDNFVHTLNGASWTTDALTLPSYLKIVAACPFGDYLAIGCITKNGSVIVKADAQSIVYLWDRDSSLTTLSQRIDLGKGELIHLAMLDNRLLAVINGFVDGTCSLGRGKIFVKLVNGDMAIILNEILTDAQIDKNTSGFLFLPRTNFTRDNKLYFPMRADLNKNERYGIWALNSNGVIALDFIEEAVSADDDIFKDIYMTGNMWWISRKRESTGVFTVTRTDDAAAYSTTLVSSYESLINGGDARLTSELTKKLIGVTVMTEPLPAAGQIILKYRKDEGLNTDAWTEIFTNTTNDSIGHGAINKAGGATLPTFKEIQFKIESTGGAVITGLKFKSEFINKELY